MNVSHILEGFYNETAIKIRASWLNIFNWSSLLIMIELACFTQVNSLKYWKGKYGKRK